MRPHEPRSAARSVERPKIFFLTRTLEQTGGAERQLVMLANGLANRGFQTGIFTFYEIDPLDRQKLDDAVTVLPLGKQGRWDIMHFATRLVTATRQEAPHILHSFLGPPNIVAASMRPFIPKHTQLVWGLRASEMDLKHYDWTWKLVRSAEIVLSSIPSAIVANSEAGLRHATHAGFARKNLISIPNGIDIGSYLHIPEEGARIREEFNIPETAPVITLVARLDPMKDHSTFLEAAAVAVRERNDIRFICVGNGSEESQKRIRTQAGNLGLDGHVRWITNRSDIRAIWNASNVGTLSSAFGEGFPNAIGEAMACEVPCVVTDVGDATLLVDDHGNSVQPGQANELARAWLDLLSLPDEQRKIIGRAARQRIIDVFSLEAMLERSIKLYEALCAAPPLRSPSRTQ
jgi:glycosyltransferase involved in cell wall biosynthesis